MPSRLMPPNGTTLTLMVMVIIGKMAIGIFLARDGALVRGWSMPQHQTLVRSLLSLPQVTGSVARIPMAMDFQMVISIGPSPTVRMLSLSNHRNGKTVILMAGVTINLKALFKSMISQIIQRNGLIQMKMDGAITNHMVLHKSMISRL